MGLRLRGFWRAPLALIAAGTGGFFLLALDVWFHGQVWRWNRPVQIFFHEHSQGGWELFFSAVSGAGELAVILGVAVIVGAALAAKKKWQALWGWGIALCGSGLLNAILKNFFRVPRPGQWTFYIFKPDSGYSFPSGHTMAVAITAGALALVMLHVRAFSQAGRWTALVVVAAVSLLEAFALLYIGVHYLTDVLGGLLVSAAWLGVVWLVLPAAREGKCGG